MTNSDQEQLAKILVEQSDRLLSTFAVDVSHVPVRDPAHIAWSGRPSVFRLAADAYDKLAEAKKTVSPVLWERTTEKDGRNGDELMTRLWDLLVEIKKD
jgi:hypothetical protein